MDREKPVHFPVCAYVRHVRVCVSRMRVCVCAAGVERIFQKRHIFPPQFFFDVDLIGEMKILIFPPSHLRCDFFWAYCQSHGVPINLSDGLFNGGLVMWGVV